MNDRLRLVQRTLCGMVLAFGIATAAAAQGPQAPPPPGGGGTVVVQSSRSIWGGALVTVLAFGAALFAVCRSSSRN